MSTLLPQYRPEDYGAGSGLIWLGDTYTYEQVTTMWPNVRWSYMYSGYTPIGELSDISMVIVDSSGTVMEDMWSTYSGIYEPGCSWVITSGFNTESSWTTGTTITDIFQVSGYVYAYSGAYLTILTSGQTLAIGAGQTAFEVAGNVFTRYDGPYTFQPMAVRTYYHSGTVGQYVLSNGAIPAALYTNFYGTPTAVTVMLSGGISTPDTRLGVIETAHTYSGTASEAWKEWTQDEAAIMEAYERTISGGTAGYIVTPTNPSGIMVQGVPTPPLLTIAPGNYNVSYGHIWFYNTCNIDARSARFFARRMTASGSHMGYSSTWRSPTGDMARAVVTVGSDRYVQCPFLAGEEAPATASWDAYARGQYFSNSDIYLPTIIAQDPVDDHYGLYDGCGIRFLAMYHSKISNISIRGAYRYAIIYSPDSDGSSYNNYHFGVVYKYLTAIKFRMRNGRTQGAWLNNSNFWEGQFTQADPGVGWDPDTAPTVMFDNDNSDANPNRDTREDSMLDIATGSQSYIQFYSVPSFWTENLSTETMNIMHFVRASGWSGVKMYKGRFEGQDDPIVTADGRIINRTWWLRGSVAGNVFDDNVSQSALTGIPSQYIGNGIDFSQDGQPIPGFSQRGSRTLYKYPEDESGENHTMKIMSQDLYLASPDANILMRSADGSKMRAIYVDEIVDSLTSRAYPVVKVRSLPHVWMKWKLSTEPDSAYTDDYVTYPTGSTIYFRFGDFESVPIHYDGAVPYIRPYITYWPNNEEEGYPVYPSGVINGIAGTGGSGSLAGMYRLTNANIVNEAYAEIQYTFTESGLISPSIWLNVNTEPGGVNKRLDQISYRWRITIA